MDITSPARIRRSKYPVDFFVIFRPDPLDFAAFLITVPPLIKKEPFRFTDAKGQRTWTAQGGGVVDEQLLSERIQIERKQFFFDLKQNPRGKFLKITEDVGGRRDTIIIPSTGLSAFRDSIQKAIEANFDAPNVEDFVGS